MQVMHVLRSAFCGVLALSFACTLLCGAEDSSFGEQKHVDFLAAYNNQPVSQRIAALRKLDYSKDQQSIETLFSISWRDPDPEVRSRAFYGLVHSEDLYGYTANLAADSFKRETEPGVKVEKAVGLSSLRYRWAALNELVNFLHAQRWSSWNFNGSGTNGAYISSGSPPEAQSDGSKPATARSSGGYDEWKNREPLRWRTEEELIGIITNTINKMSGTQIESRPRIDQEITKWWERKSDQWLEYDRKLRSKIQANAQPVKFKEVKDIHDDELQPGKDTARDIVTKSASPSKDEKPLTATKRVLTGPADE
jgi:hypothetical protein